MGRQLPSRAYPGAISLALVAPAGAASYPQAMQQADGFRAAFRYTPYDGSAKPFTIGLKPLNLADWIEVDGHFAAYLAEKRHLYATVPDQVLVGEDGTETSQHETLELIRDHLLAHYPQTFRQSGEAVEILATGDRIETGAGLDVPLRNASLLVQEDLILMRKGPEGWRLVAGSLCFPSSWSLREKFGRPMHAIHEPVPGFGPGTRMDELIARMFDNMQVGQPVQRYNWSIQDGGALFMPLSERQLVRRAEKGFRRFAGGAMSSGFIRVERQTLRKLPLSGDILFTIRIYLDPLDQLRRHEDRRRLAAGLADQLAALDSDQLEYKGLLADRDDTVAQLRAIAAE